MDVKRCDTDIYTIMNISGLHPFWSFEKNALRSLIRELNNRVKNNNQKLLDKSKKYIICISSCKSNAALDLSHVMVFCCTLCRSLFLSHFLFSYSYSASFPFPPFLSGL